MSNPNPNDRSGHPLQGDLRTTTSERIRPLHEDHRRTTQRTPLSNTSTWRAVFLMGGWRLALALVLIFFIFVCWALIQGNSESGVPVESDTQAMTTPQATLYPTMTVAAGAEKVKTLPEGAVLDIIGANKTVDDIVWRNVRDAAGSEGWVAASFVVANQ
jgi:hypothetical protein